MGRIFAITYNKFEEHVKQLAMAKQMHF